MATNDITGDALISRPASDKYRSNYDAIFKGQKVADEADRSEYFVESVIDDGVKEAMRKAAEIPPGNPGECDTCGEYSGRLVNGACAWCRDKYGL